MRILKAGVLVSYSPVFLCEMQQSLRAVLLSTATQCTIMYCRLVHYDTRYA
jgi:hypothetical protein